jgi:hypothetical protein
MAKRSIIGALCIVGETAGWQLPAVQMIAYTSTTVAFAGARFITAIAFLKIFFDFTFHNVLPSTTGSNEVTVVRL